MQWTGKTAAWAAAWMLACAACAAPLDRGFEKAGPSADARELVQWVQRTGDADRQPYVVVDKKAARMYVFDASGRLRAATPVLLGATPGDDGTPGVGERAQAGLVGPDERTTPAGRYETQPGRNLDGESIVWLDYDAALAIHRLRPGRGHALRKARLAQSDPDQRRLSLGCVVVPVDFYLSVVEPLLGRHRGVVYVMPETRPARELFTAM